MSRRRSRQRHSTSRSNVEAALLIAIPLGIVLTVMIVAIVRHDRALSERDAWIHRIPWHPSWPALPISERTSRLPIDVARALYAFAGTHAEVVDYIPCYCGCRAQGHRSSGDCSTDHRKQEEARRDQDWHGKRARGSCRHRRACRGCRDHRVGRACRCPRHCPAQRCGRLVLSRWSCPWPMAAFGARTPRRNRSNRREIGGKQHCEHRHQGKGSRTLSPTLGAILPPALMTKAHSQEGPPSEALA